MLVALNNVKNKLYLNSYFYDYDHPYGIIIYEIEKEELEITLF